MKIRSHPYYHIYMNQKYRCTKPTHVDYYLYGGRGIQFKFTSFWDWLLELGPRPTENHSVDRIDNNGHYEYGNIRWATPKEQRLNQRPKFNKFGLTGLSEIKPSGNYKTLRYVVRITDSSGKRIELYKGPNLEIAKQVLQTYTNKMKV